jgi:pyruvate kinase
MRRLNLLWGTYPLVKTIPDNLEKWEELARATAIEAGLVKEGDVIVVTAGLPLGVPGTTNMVKVQRV